MSPSARPTHAHPGLPSDRRCRSACRTFALALPQRRAPGRPARQRLSVAGRADRGSAGEGGAATLGGGRGATGAGEAVGDERSVRPIEQANLVNTWQNVGYNGPVPANTVVTVQATGQAGLPTSGVSAVVLTVMTINTSGTTRTRPCSRSERTGRSTSGRTAQRTHDLTSKATSPRETATPPQAAMCRALPKSFRPGHCRQGPTSAAIQVSEVGAVPTTATAVWANLVIDSFASADQGSLVAFPASTSPPCKQFSFEAGNASYWARRSTWTARARSRSTRVR